MSVPPPSPPAPPTDATPAEVDAFLARWHGTARAAEEAKGKVRWLRPDFQNPASAETARRKVTPAANQTRLALGLDGSKKPKSRAKPAWPKERPAQVEAVAAALQAAARPAAASELAAAFARGHRDTVAEILKALVVLGRARPGEKRGTYTAA
jgi:hypothetical protein